jgi:tetratricopeptide (TPR) repeat protein
MGYEQFGPAGPYTPDKAARNGVSGLAIIQCKAASSGDLSACEILYEAPGDFGFGPASRALIAAHRVKAPASVRPPPGAPDVIVRLTVPFILPGAHADPMQQLFFQSVDDGKDGRWDEALAGLTSVIKARPNYAPAFLKRAEIYQAQGRNDDALADLDRTIALRNVYDPRPKLYDSTGQRMFAEQDLDYALAYYLRATIRADRGLSDLAIDDYGQALSMAPDYRDAVLDRGATYDERGQYDLAVADADRAIKLKPGADAYRVRGAADAHAGRQDLALANFGHALELDPKDAQAYLARGAIFFGKAAYDRAIQDFDQAIASAPKLAAAFQYRALARAMSGQGLEQALADCDQELAFQPNDPGALSVRSLVNFRLARYDRAVADADTAAAAGAHTARTLFVGGAAKRRLGRSAEGDADIAAALVKDPKIREAASGYGVTP